MSTTDKERTVEGARERRCSSCEGWFPLDAFYAMGGVPSWRCKSCQKQATADYVARNPEKRKATARRSRFNQTLNYYGITREEFDAMVLAQEGRCFVCVRPKELQIDHCHSTGKVRGLLCGECNKALGLLQDDPAIIANLIGYLTQTAEGEGFDLCFSTAGDSGYFAYARLTPEMAQDLYVSLGNALNDC